MKHIFPKNYFKEALVSLLLGIIGLCITLCPNEQYHDLLLTIGGGMFTGAIVNISTFTAHSLKNRREDLEGFLELAESIYGRFRWIKNPGNVNQHNLYDFLKILDDGKGLNRIYGRLWFVRDETRKKVHELYCVLFEIQKIQPCIMRLEMTAETSKSVKAEEIMNPIFNSGDANRPIVDSSR